MPPNPEDHIPGQGQFSAQEEVLKHVDVQKFMSVLNDLLTGKKRLVIESRPFTYPVTPDHAKSGTRHTFKVEDAK